MKKEQNSQNAETQALNIPVVKHCCPNCKSENIKHYEITQLINPHCRNLFSSISIDDYYSCRNCGIRFDIINNA
jgi:hypothetical protein